MRLLGLAAFVYAAVLTTSLTAAPTISGVYNAGSWLPPALPNSGVAQGAIFTVTGSGLGPSALVQGASYPLPTTEGLAGTTIEVTVGGVTKTCIMIYTLAAQAAAILPSATPVGTGTLTLSYQGAKSSLTIQVLAADFGTFTLNEGGTGPGVLTDASYHAITMINAAHPGETLILWGTGLGAVSGDETEPPQQVDLGTGVRVLVGNKPATVTYGGRGSSPGLDQINFVVPEGVTGCKASVAVIVKGVTGNVTTTSVALAGQTTCSDTYNALSADNLQKAIASGALNLAEVQLSRIAGGNDNLIAGFESLPVNSLIRSYGGTFAPSLGSCLAYETSGTSIVLKDPIQPTYLDAGLQLKITGPDGNKTINVTSTGLFEAILATEPSVYIEPGPYSVQNGSGGTNVGAFNWSVTLPAYVVPNIPASFNLAEDLTLTWTGGGDTPVVSIIAYNGVKATASMNSYVYLLCTADGSAGSFTIPSEILNLFPNGGYGTPTKPGVNIQVAGIPSSRFTVAGSPGIDAGIFSVFVSNGAVSKIQ